MKRREFLKGVGVGAAALATQRQAGGAEKPAKPPNIVFLLTDDQRWDTMGCAGNKIIKTPNMDDMAGKGVMFTNAFVTTSICCTSRANIFTGQYALRHGKRSFRSSFSISVFSKFSKLDRQPRRSDRARGARRQGDPLREANRPRLPALAPGGRGRRGLRRSIGIRLHPPLRR